MVDRIATAHEGNLFFAQPHKKGDGNLFGVRHHGDEVQYDASDFLELNAENQICADFIALFRGGAETTGSSNPFIANLFSEKVIDVKRAKKTVVVAQQDNGPRRKPSIRRKKGQSERAASGKATFGSQYREALDDLLDSLGETNVHFVFCVRPDVEGGSVAFDEAKVAAQLKSMGIADILRITSKGYGDGVALDTFVERYRVLAPDTVDRATSARTKVEAIAAALGWDADEITFGTKLAFLSETAVRALNLSHARAVREEKKRLKEKIAQSRLDGAASGEDYSDVGSDVGSIGHSDIGDGSSTAGTDFTYGSDAESETGTGMPEKVMASVVADGAVPPIKKKVEPANEEEVEEISTVRKCMREEGVCLFIICEYNFTVLIPNTDWLRLTTFLTWWIPACCLRRSGMVRADIQQAWREKVAICILIFLLSGTMVFFIAGFSLIMCPRDNMYDLGELAGYVTPQEQWIAVHGNIYNYANQEHRSAPEEIREWAGRDASELFPLYADECGIKEDVPSSDRVANTTGFPHPPGTWKTKLTKKNKKIWKGYLAFRRDEIKEHNKAKDFWIIVENDVFDMTWYRVFDQGWLGSEATGIIFASGGMDATDAFQNMQTREGKAALKCMKNVFFKGKVDSRDNPACIFANTLLLTATGILVTILVIKFLCAFQLGSSGDPENHDRFVMLQVPCYTEGEDSLRRTIESLTSLRYDDKRKLLFLIADGNIIGSGNDRPTWRIVLDILGVDPSIDPPKLSYLALGEGNKQQNMAKVYTGLYDFQGHLVPYIVVVKVGKDSETRRPGNRGKVGEVWRNVFCILKNSCMSMTGIPCYSAIRK